MNTEKKISVAGKKRFSSMENRIKQSEALKGKKFRISSYRRN